MFNYKRLPLVGYTLPITQELGEVPLDITPEPAPQLGLQPFVERDSPVTVHLGTVRYIQGVQRTIYYTRYT